MNELINVVNDEAVTTSLQVADVFEKQHKNVLRIIENLNQAKIEPVEKMFKKSTYIDAKGEPRPMFFINRDGFSLLVMGFTGKKALQWKLKYIEAFNKMESYINMRKADKQIQKNAMEFLHNNLDMPSKKDYCKANTIANKAVSTLFGFPKMVKKGEMSADMLEQREPILVETVELMAVEDKYKLGISVSESIYKRHTAIEG